MRKLFTYLTKSRLAFYLLPLIILLGFGLRLLAWNWREFYGLGGDELEYLNQALTLLRDRQYVELRLMRPPLYTIFLAANIYLFDSLVQNLRLVQVFISTATIPLVYLATRAIAVMHAVARPERPALLAAALGALSYSLAVNATELLTETLFLFGLTAVIWLLLRTAQTRSVWPALAAGLIVGALCLVRSVGLPLLPLGAVWLLIASFSNPAAAQAGTETDHSARRTPYATRLLPSIAFILAVGIVLVPWTTRNYLTYGGLILIDTTGAENLWLDNDPAGREAVKAQLYALGEDRLLRQQRSTERGIEVIRADPGRFAVKAAGELQRFFALEFSDDMRNRPAIWVPPAEVALRLIFGDGIWLLLLISGSYGLALGLFPPQKPHRVGQIRRSKLANSLQPILSVLRSPAWILAPWAGYILLTTLIFHVELRYRLPLYPALLPYAALTLLGGWAAIKQSMLARWMAAIVPIAAIMLTLWHQNYPLLAWQLANKHWSLSRAEAALEQGETTAAILAAERALGFDERSALAHVVLAQAAIQAQDHTLALEHLDAAITVIPFHPYAHLLRGDLLRAAGDTEAAQRELRAFETASLQDLQRWSWERFITPPPTALDLGNSLDLGFIQGFHAPAAAEADYRWTTNSARIRLAAPPDSDELRLELAAGWAQRGTVPVTVEIAGQRHIFQVATDRTEQRIALPANHGAVVEITIHAPTFTPRQYDPGSPDGRTLGVLVASAAIE
ncbi:MAG: hypothetical protein HC822_18985 [Oscillochloris sp.]|nr:hypothetical protein [Oscillochloris sp.]